jgi:hypothetical protein
MAVSTEAEWIQRARPNSPTVERVGAGMVVAVTVASVAGAG